MGYYLAAAFALLALWLFLANRRFYQRVYRGQSARVILLDALCVALLLCWVAYSCVILYKVAFVGWASWMN